MRFYIPEALIHFGLFYHNHVKLAKEQEIMKVLSSFISDFFAENAPTSDL